MQFDLVPPMEPAAMFGTAWTIYAQGLIDDDAPKRLDDMIKKNGIPGRSDIFLSSPGGSLFAGMKLGRLIRDYRLRSYVGAKNDDPSSSAKSSICLSACALTFLGGSFRFVGAGSIYGVHRFYATEKGDLDGDTAQIVSAAVLQYIRDMGADPQLFTEMTQSGPDEMHILTDARMTELDVVNNGVGKTEWTVESIEGGVYLQGHRDTVWGEQKLMLFCRVHGSLEVLAMFVPYGRQSQVANMLAISLFIDRKQMKLSPNSVIENPTVGKNFWVSISVRLDRNMVSMLRGAKTVGVVAQYTFEAPTFLGFDSMDFTAGAKKLPGLLSTCR